MMAFVAVDEDKTWVGLEGFTRCPQVIRGVTGDNPYVVFDFTDVLTENQAISSAALSESSSTYTATDNDISASGKKVSFKVHSTGTTTAGDYIYRCLATLSSGTANLVSLEGILRLEDAGS
jgi:hypothetical protein